MEHQDSPPFSQKLASKASWINYTVSHPVGLWEAGCEDGSGSGLCPMVGEGALVLVWE